jgi:hypothetical protein
LDCKAASTELPAVLEEKYRKVQIKGAIWTFYWRTLPLLQFSVTIRRLYLYPSLNNHASLESTIIKRTQRPTVDSFMTHTSRDEPTGMG